MTLQPLIMLCPLGGHAKDDGCRVCAYCGLSGEDRLALAYTPVDQLPPSLAGACCFTLRSAGVHMLAG
jgi:hypothetical protein